MSCQICSSYTLLSNSFFYETLFLSKISSLLLKISSQKPQPTFRPKLSSSLLLRRSSATVPSAGSMPKLTSPPTCLDPRPPPLSKVSWLGSLCRRVFFVYVCHSVINLFVCMTFCSSTIRWWLPQLHSPKFKFVELGTCWLHHAQTVRPISSKIMLFAIFQVNWHDGKGLHKWDCS